MNSIFEMIMLLCFGIAWPVSVYKTWKSKETGGKSIFFSYIVLAGYVSGIIHKLLHSNDFVLYLYILNLAMVVLDIAMYYRAKRYENAAGK
jgi:hypothetical protein